MEKRFVIPTKDGKKIFAKLNGSFQKPLILMVHGLGGSMDEALHHNATQFFVKKGFSVFRFNLYSWEKGGRTMPDCTLKTHGNDIDTVVNFLKRKGTRKIFAIGHSYGAPSILHSDHSKFDGVIFWDGSYYTISKHFLTLKYISAIKGRLLQWGVQVVIGEKMVQEAARVNSIKLIRKLTSPIAFFCAGRGVLIKGGRAMFKAAPTEKLFHIIKGASHNFEEEGVQERLYSATALWIKKFL